MQCTRRGLRVFTVTVAMGTLMIPSVFADHTADPTSVAVIGDLQSELGCPGDWQPDCVVMELATGISDPVWRATFTVPAGAWQYKVALNDSFTENYGANGTQNNIDLTLGVATDVRFYYSHETHWVADNQGAVIANLPGTFQDELGCSGDWQPECLQTWLQDLDGDGTYTFTSSAIPVGDWEVKVAHDESWTENYGAGGIPGGSNILFSVVNAGLDIIFTYDPVTHLLGISGPGLPVELLALTVE